MYRDGVLEVWLRLLALHVPHATEGSGIDLEMRPFGIKGKTDDKGEFVFLVGIPTMFAASGYELAKELGSGVGSEDWAGLGVAFLASTVTAFVVVKWLLGYIRSHRFTAFAIYRLVFGGLLLALSGAGLLT
mgnify:CR=1 FL=1